jgi:RNA-binding protein 5/10
LSHKAPPKKIQLQLKSWTAKANSSESLNNNLKCKFVAEESVHKSKSKFIDLTFLCCLLCDIKFDTEEELLNHAQNSEEHAQKFEDYWKQSITEQKESECYLDRAAERRDAFGVNEEELKKIAKERQDIRSTVKTPNNQLSTPSNESIGTKLMKKMGWKEGSGLGKDSDGIVEAIKAKTLENSSAGIGAANIITADEITPKSYNDIVRKGRKKRYHE